MSSKELCEIFWEDKNPGCDNSVRATLADRRQQTHPRTWCGTPVGQVGGATPGGNAASATSQGSTTGAKNLQSLTNELIKPITRSAQCTRFIAGLTVQSNPMNAACTSRYKSLDDETIVCRAELNQFIEANSQGVGKNFASCGVKIKTPVVSAEKGLVSFYTIRDAGAEGYKKYLDQFDPNRKQVCETLARQNDVDGLFCLYDLAVKAKDWAGAADHLFAAGQRGHPVANYEIYLIATIDSKENDPAARSALINAAVGGFYLAIELLGN